MNIQNSGGRVIDPLKALDRVAEVYVSEGKISSIGEAPSRWQADRDNEARCCVVSPGFVDLAARLREP
jgi:dihydroorotase